LKGFPRSVPAWRVLREAPAASRFAAIRAGGNAPFIGRANEMGLALERWRPCAPGRGPSRHGDRRGWTRKFAYPAAARGKSLTAEPHRPRTYCNARHITSDSALYPAVTASSRTCGRKSNAARTRRMKTSKSFALCRRTCRARTRCHRVLADIFCAARDLADSPHPP